MPVIMINQIKGTATRVKKEKPVDDNTWMMQCQVCGVEKPMPKECMTQKGVICQECQRGKK